MSANRNPSSIVVEDQVTYLAVSAVLAPAAKTAAVTQVRYLEGELYDDSGHIRRGVTPARAEQIVALINQLRQRLGWLEIDLDGSWRWPESVSTRTASLQRVA